MEVTGELDPVLRARALRDFGGCAQMAGDVKLADRAYAESLELFRVLGDQRNIGELIHRQSTRALTTGHIEIARRLMEESLDIALAVGNRWGECQVLGSLAHVARADGALKRAAELFEQSAAIAVEIGNVWWETNMVGNLAELDLAEGRIDDAAPRARRMMTLARDHGDRPVIPWGLLYFARIALARTDLRRAGILLGSVEAEESRRPIVVGDFRDDYDALLAPLLEIEDPVFERGRADGRLLTLEEAVDLALSQE